MSDGVTLWRVSNYATLDGIGGMYVSGRWHTKGHPVLYCSEDPSTALLETLVHIEIDAEDRPQIFQVLKIRSSQLLSIERVNVKKLSPDWPSNRTHTRAAGDDWLRSGKSLLLEVPSVLVPERRNFLINPLHSEMKNLRIAARYSHAFDRRFFK
ncbi:MAG TPA: RES family NAD+ phosphorylase [Acidobacteriaceae bacterium]|nr:RES family NAD+ phosphorylase [Acidobacteriaceae bacterium]